MYLGRGALFCPPPTLQYSPGGGKRLMNKQELLRLEGIEKSFGPIRALQNVSLVLYRGEVLGLVGDNGAGKSTLVKVISGAVMPDKGKIFFEGRQVHLKSPKDSRALGIEMVYQDLSLCESLTVAQNLFLGREPTKRVLGIPFLDKPRLENQTRRILSNLNIHIPSIRAQVKYLSGGQRQSIAIGRAVTFEPKILILDEPTASLAVAEVEKVLRLVKDLRARGIAIILISHRLQDVIEVADRIIVMYEGQVVAQRRCVEVGLEELVSLISQSKRLLERKGNVEAA